MVVAKTGEYVRVYATRKLAQEVLDKTEKDFYLIYEEDLVGFVSL